MTSAQIKAPAIPEDVMQAARKAVADCGHFAGDGEIERIVCRGILAERERSQWQDIATAPKNTKVLAGYWNRHGKWRSVTACYHTQLEWSDEYGDHEQEYAPEGWYEENDSSEVIYPTSCAPTHWQPLPAAPKGGA